MYAEIKCPKCHTEVQVDQIDLSSNKAQCLTCSHVYSIQGAIKKIRKKIRVQLPEGFATTKSINHLELEIPLNTNIPSELKKVHGCFQLISIIPIVLVVFFMSFWCIGFINQSIERQQTGNIILGVAFTLFAIGCITYFFRTRKGRNFTLITIDDKDLKISLPTLKKNDDGKTQFPTKDSKFKLSKLHIKQLYIVKSAHYYNVLILDEEDNIIDPMYPFFNLDQALYIEQSIEDILGISDEIMSDEIKL